MTDQGTPQTDREQGMSLRLRVATQFSKPSGALGALAGWVMASRPSNVARNRWTVDLLEVGSNDRVLEIGCGPGLSLAHCLSLIRDGCVVGIDHSDVMIAQASKRNASALKRGKLALFTGGIELPPTLGLTFTKALSVNVAQFFPDKTQLFAAIAAAMAPRGLVAATYQPRHARPTLADALRTADVFAEAMTKVGLSDIRHEVLPLAPAPAVCVLGRRP